MDSQRRPLFATRRYEQTADFGRRVWPARKFERRPVAEIARIHVGVGSSGADHAFCPRPRQGRYAVKHAFHASILLNEQSAGIQARGAGIGQDSDA
jgi:hypothetical protein